MSKHPPPQRRPADEARRRFAWVDDDVLFLKIDGQDVKSTPPEESDAPGPDDDPANRNRE
jgi:hypothetical protein